MASQNTSAYNVHMDSCIVKYPAYHLSVVIKCPQINIYH